MLRVALRSSRPLRRSTRSLRLLSSASGRDGDADGYARLRAAAQADKWKRAGQTQSLEFQIDRSALKQPAASAASAAASAVEKTRETPLVHLLRTMIEVKGPLTVSEFMTRALSHPDHGYYMKRDVFGRQGDFTTAPEISQMFGELVGIWCVATWQQMGMPQAVQVVELGPGRGSLMSDFLRAARSFPPFYSALDIHMVEISPALRRIQQETLGCEEIDEAATAANRMRVGSDGPTVRWHEELAHVPHKPSLFIAQELFDALPVHQFEYTDRGWCERLVDVDYEDGEDHLRFVLSPGATPAARVYIGREKIFDPSAGQQVVIDPSDPQGHNKPSGEVRTAEAQVGDRIEISPVGIALAQDLARRIKENGGGALIVDYGHDHPSSVSLRGIKDHEFVSVLREPGDVDLSIDVDFATLRRFATQEAPDVVVASGPIGQGQFLRNMGIEHRLAALLENAESDEQAQELFSSYERLVQPDQMGSIFKAMALTHADLGAPVGFEQVPTEDEEE